MLEEEEEEDYLEEDESEDEDAVGKASSPENNARHSQDSALASQVGSHFAPAAPVHYGPALSGSSSRAPSDFDEDEELPI